MARESTIQYLFIHGCNLYAILANIHQKSMSPSNSHIERCRSRAPENYNRLYLSRRGQLYARSVARSAENCRSAQSQGSDRGVTNEKCSEPKRDSQNINE